MYNDLPYMPRLAYCRHDNGVGALPCPTIAAEI